MSDEAAFLAQLEGAPSDVLALLAEITPGPGDGMQALVSAMSVLLASVPQERRACAIVTMIEMIELGAELAERTGAHKSFVRRAPRQ